VVGGGVAGALLAWRLCGSAEVDVYGVLTPGDASAASGGLVRGFDRSPEACALAVESLVELRSDERLRAAAGYCEAGSVYLLPAGYDPAESVKIVEDGLPGSVTVLGGVQLADRFRGLSGTETAVMETCAGWYSPARLRSAALGWLGERVHQAPVARVDSTPRVLLADGTAKDFDVVVVAAGAWTPTLLAASGLSAEGTRTKQIQYTLCSWRPEWPEAFVDEVTGLYGRPDGDNGCLVGLPCDRWDIDPDDVRPDLDLPARVVAAAGARIGLTGSPRQTVASIDCFVDPPGLRLREVAPGVVTFTGGSGGAAKTVLASGRQAAAQLLA
jgi:glycine/D-amino acid oxidase-like deaminating enzyme